MPRNKPLKTKRILALEQDIKSAIYKLLVENMSIQVAAEMHHMSKSKLCCHIKEAKEQGEDFFIELRNVPNQVFTSKQESDLENYLIKASQLHHGLTTIDARKLAYEFAKALFLKFPNKWDSDKKACFYRTHQPNLMVQYQRQVQRIKYKQLCSS